MSSLIRICRNPNSQNPNAGEGNNASSSARPLSIEAPRTQNNANRMQVVPNQPRQPADLQGLLRFAMEATKAEDAPNQSTFQPMDEEVNGKISNTISLR